MSYKKLGLKCGVEIHQQLEGKKLFSDELTQISEDNSYDFSIQRKIRAVAGEDGSIDVAAAQEQSKDRVYIYRGKNISAGLIAADSQPPLPINDDALYASLQLSTMLGAQLSPVIQVMRKTIADGSNTSGFQRTALVARAGVLKGSLGDVGIDSVGIEEDSCRTLSSGVGVKEYHLDRLGIPLIEIATAPDIKSPEQAQEVCRLLGNYLRSLPNCKRGLGTIRQDVNVSIKGGNRVEIKGAQDLRMIPTLVELEMKRQEELLKLRSELKKSLVVKAALKEKVQIKDLSTLFSKSSSKRIVSTLKKKGKVLALTLPGFAGLVGRELQPNYRLGTEFAGRAKVKAGVGGIFHSDELPNYGITADEVAAVCKKLKCKKEDAFILVADHEGRASVALHAVWERAGELLVGVPKEVRKAQVDGTSRYMRPMPGAARMYPETDVPLIFPSKFGKIELPELLENKFARFEKEYGLSKDLAAYIAKSSRSALFEELARKYKGKVKSAFIAETLGPTLLGIKREFKVDVPSLLSDGDLRKLFAYLIDDKIHKDIIVDVLIDMAKGSFDLKKYGGLSTEEIHKVIVSIVKKNKGAPFGALMGQCMKALAGKASGQVISKALKEIVAHGHK